MQSVSADDELFVTDEEIEQPEALEIAWDTQAIQRRVIKLALCIVALALVSLLALWLYAAWLDVQPVTRPKIFIDRPRGNICYYTRDNLFCLPE